VTKIVKYPLQLNNIKGCRGCFKKVKINKKQTIMSKLTHKQLSENASFLASKYTKGSKLNKVYLKMSRREFIKSLIKFEWLWNKQ
jgi:histidyl-tRNA synthetase